MSVMISPIHRMSDRILQLAPLHCAYPSSQRKIRGPGMPHCAWRVIAITRCKFYPVRSMRCSMRTWQQTECQAAAIHTRLFHYCTKLSRSASSRFSVRKGWANAFHQPLTNTWNLDRHEQRHLGRRDPVQAKTRHMGSRGHIGDTLSCVLLLLERHSVRSGSCRFLHLRLGFPLSRR